ncbi:hypothetical protein AB1L42_20895 [Thalassoglobus sp. JC818]|uniref:hypothetical protein n=1 Tax=Thalassoglobus sp. JC818 TaxID=3232136 RepID=UPI003459B504
MPIKFRCPHCEQFLGISRSRAGAITDCPTCGRTIRVPQLDGSIVPLPKPEINLGDSQLRDALSALASLEGDSSAQLTLTATSTEKSASKSRSEPEVIDSVDPRPVVVPIAEKQSVEALDASISDGEIDVLAELGKLNAAPSSSYKKVNSPAPQTSRHWRWLILGGVAACGFSFLLGRMSSNASSVEEPQAVVIANKVPAPDPEVVVPPVAPEAEENPETPVAADQQDATLVGIVTWTDPAGETRPDKGARVLILPRERSGKSRLPEEGLRVGANSSDEAVLSAAIAALGGQLTEADSEGKFHFAQLPPGQYGVLVVSRFQSASSAQQLAPEVIEFLQTYFNQPERLWGRVQANFQFIKVPTEQGKQITVEFSDR